MMSTVPDINLSSSCIGDLVWRLEAAGQMRVNISGNQDHLRNRAGQAVRVCVFGMSQTAPVGFCPAAAHGNNGVGAVDGLAHAGPRY